MNDLFDLSFYQDKFIYRVQNGDTIKSIAEKFHTQETFLISLNALTEEVCVGDILLVEKIKGEPYIVKPLDTLEKIAGYDKDRIFEIINKNKTDVIFVGQKLFI